MVRTVVSCTVLTEGVTLTMVVVTGVEVVSTASVSEVGLSTGVEVSADGDSIEGYTGVLEPVGETSVSQPVQSVVVGVVKTSVEVVGDVVLRRTVSVGVPQAKLMLCIEKIQDGLGWSCCSGTTTVTFLAPPH